MAFLRCVFCILMCYFIGVSAQDCQSRPLTDSRRLIRDLFCNYEKSAVPKNVNNTNTEVRIAFILKEFYFYTYTEELDVHVFTVLNWLDKNLSWNRSLYGGISAINVDTNLIWMPELEIQNLERTKEGDMGLSGAMCILLNIGVVHCTVTSSFSIPCTADITRWPYDSQSCRAIIKPWTRSDADFQLNVRTRKRDISLVYGNIYTASREWNLQEAKLLKVLTPFENTTYSHIELVMEMERHGNMYEATAVMPGLVLALATLVSFWMHHEINIRFCLCATAVAMDCSYLQYLGYTLHENGASCPLIVLFYRDHLLTSAAALLIAFTVYWMYNTELKVPVLATSIVHPIFTSRSVSWLLLVEPTTDAAEEKKQQWQPLAVLLDRLSFVGFSVTFIILYAICF